MVLVPQYVVVNFTTGSVPADGTKGTAEVWLTTQADEHAAAQFVADRQNAPTGATLYAAVATNFTPHVVSRTVT